MFWHAFARLFICRNNSKIYGQSLMKFSENVNNGLGKRWFDFSCDPDHHLDPNNFNISLCS